MKVIKRNGLEEPLTKKKIYDSIVKANECVEKENQLTQKQIKRITDAVFEACQDFEEPIPIDKIEDMIEKKLMEASGYEVAKKYITYRYEKERVRRNQHLTEKLMAANVVNQNANVDEFSFGGRIGEAASFIMREYTLNNLLSPMAKNNHLNNEIYIHDLDHYAVGDHNCLSIPFDKLLANGFNTRQADIRPASSINTAMQLVAVIFQLQSLQQFGGVAATHLDWTMVPYIRKSFKKYFLEGLKYINEASESTISEIKNKLDSYVETNKCLINIGAPTVVSINDQAYGNTNSKVYCYALEKTTKELEQAVEGMYHNLNTLQSRSGNQLPFTSINYGTCTLPEGRMAIKALLNESINGVGKFHKTSIFPCGIFQCGKGINLYKDDPNYDLFLLALKSTSTRLYPNYANIDWSNNAGYDKNDPRTYFSTMGCHEKDTLIWMADGSKKKVQDIVVGDKVMGPDRKSRIVEKLINGTGKLVRVKYIGGDSYVVNMGHVLAIRCSKTMNVTVPFGIASSFDPNNKMVAFQQMSFNKDTVYFMRVFEFMEYPAFKDFLKGYDVNGNLFDIEIEKVGDGEFFGFDIDKDRLYIIDNGIVTHNCRTANGADINAEPGQNIQMKDGRGNICPVTIIMPTLAKQVFDKVNAEYDKDIENDIDWLAGKFEDRCVEEFLKLLDKKIHEAKDMLLERFDWICSQPAKSAKFMYENGTMIGYHPEEGIRSALKHGTLVIGQIGLAETLQLLIGQDHTTNKGMEVAKKIEQLFKDRCAEFKKQYKLNFGVYLTPAENLCKTSMNRFKEKYGEIPNVSDKKYFTNSTHVPVWKKMTPFEKIDIEAQLACYSNAGCITYTELDAGTINNIEALEKLVVYALEKDIPYFAINVPSDTCMKCGYQGVINDECPQCGSENIQRLRRVTGYLTGDYKTAFNEGKQQEVEMRVKHNGICVDA